MTQITMQNPSQVIADLSIPSASAALAGDGAPLIVIVTSSRDACGPAVGLLSPGHLT